MRKARTAVALKAATPLEEAPVLRLQAYEGFKQQLLDSNLRPGEFVSQRKLCALLGLPLGAIREVIPRLEAEGLIKTVPQRGLQIANVDLKLVKNAFQLRLILEREGAQRYGETVTDAELDALAAKYRSIVDRSKRGVTRELLDEAQAADWGLHDRMIDSLGNEIISQLYRVNMLRIKLIRLDRVVLTPEALLPAMNEHLELVAALRTRRPREIAAAIERHLTSARDRALGL
ncbi:MAG TPA: GntR family transcriptional regulator [Casimicrobiaceae bacterium]|nr:GntR family transcriptional regulator [Casimicrobiaceae bacterium]